MIIPVTIGISDKHTVMVDLDNVSFRKAKGIAKLACKHFKLEGFIILKSSPEHYHIVFDKPIKHWSKVLKIISWIAILSNNPDVWKWACMQAIKESCTLRISEKPTENGVKPKPRIVYRFGRQNRQVKAYLQFKRQILRLLKHLNAESRLNLRANFYFSSSNV